MIAMDNFKYLSREENRHGDECLYARRHGKRVRLREKEGTPAFAKEYIAAIEHLDAVAPGQRAAATAAVTHAPGSLGWLGALHFQSKGDGDFLTLTPDSQMRRRNILEECFKVPLSENDPDPMGNCPLKYLTAQKVKRMIEAGSGPGARANRRKHLSVLCAWGVDNNHLATNLVRDVKAGRRIKSGGFYPWVLPDVEQFLTYHRAQTGTQSKKAILALGLLLFSGTRRQDMVTLGKQHCRGPKPDMLGDWIRYVPKKTMWKRRTLVQKPLLPVLKQIIDDAADVLGSMTFLETSYGKPFTKNGIGNWFRDRCDEAGLTQCTAHGLKKCGATIAAENGATTRQLMAMFDWDTPEMAEVYTRGAEQKRLAGQGMFLITLDQSANRDCRTFEDSIVAPRKE